MTGHRLEVADVFLAHQDQFIQRWGRALSDQQRKALRDIGLCRTPSFVLSLTPARAEFSADEGEPGGSPAMQVCTLNHNARADAPP